MAEVNGRFVYANPMVIRWGPGSIAGLSEELDRLGAGGVALVTTRSLTKAEELMHRLSQALGSRRIEATAVVRQHAPVADLEAAVELVARSAAEAVVSFGGGSPIDAAKVVAVRVAEQRGRSAPLPHLAVPTTLSAAELASGAGMTDASGTKVGLRDPRMLPAAVIYDADLTLATPLDLWLSTGIRALDHAVETVLAAGSHPLPDVLALEAVRRLFKTLPEAKACPEDLEVRTQNQLAAWFSFTLPGPAAAGLSHTMGKQIGARYGIPHGVTSCLLLPHVMRYLTPKQPRQMAELARAMGTTGSAADAVFTLIRDLGLPQRISAYGIGEPELREAAATLAGSYPAEDLLAIYLAAL
jgi:maleylacetate reductase